jgi:hypothetical protein
MNINELISPETFRIGLRRWYVLLILLTIACVLALLTYAVLPRKYFVTATVIGTRYESDITPNNQSSAFSAAALLGGSTNDLPNINDFRLYSQLLVSPELGATIIDDPIVHRIFKRQWQKDHWAAPDTLSHRIKQFFAGLVGREAWSPPDGFSVARYMTSELKLTPGKDAKLLTIGIWNEDPEFAKAIINLLNSRADGMVKGMAQKRFDAKVAFLEQAISAANVEETRLALGQALAKAETDRVYSLSNLPFAAEFLAPPDAPNSPQFPDLGTVLSLYFAGGVVIFLFDLFHIKQKGNSLFVLNGRGTRESRLAQPESRMVPTGGTAD